MPELRGQHPVLRAKVLGDNTRVTDVGVDPAGRTVTLSNSHWKIHEGAFYSVGYYNAAVANGASIQIIVEIPSTIEGHTSIKLNHGGDVTLQLYEGVTYTDPGTSITPQNHNRCFANTSVVTSSHTPTSPVGTQIWQEFFPGGTGGGAPGAVATVGEQVVLCSSTVYMFEATNISGVNEPLNLVISYYEVTV